MTDPATEPLYLPIMEIPQWVVWRYQVRDPKKKPTKVPYRAIAPGIKASTTDPSTWGTYSEAQTSSFVADGIGFVFAPDDGFLGIDLDHCFEHGTLAQWAREIVDAMDSYTELSPSGEGLHILVGATLPAGGRKRGPTEIYDQGRYFTFTGNVFEGKDTIYECQDAVDTLYASLTPQDVTVYEEPAPAPMQIDDAEIIRLATRAKNGAKFKRLWDGDTTGYPSASEADMALSSMLTFWVGRDPQRIDRLMRQSGLARPKWDEKHFGDGRTYGQATAERAATTTREVFRETGPRASGTFARTALGQDADPETGELPSASNLDDGRVDLWKYISGGVPEPVWLVNGVLLPGMVELFHGEPGCGKTILALGFTRDLVREGKTVLFIDEESGPTMTAARLAMMGITEEEADRIHYYPFTGITLGDAEELLYKVLELRPAMVIFDSMADVLTASHLSEDASTDVTNWMVTIAVKLARSVAAPCVVILDHNTKDGANTKYARGSGAKKAKADIAWYVEKKVDFDAVNLGRVALERTKNRPGFVPATITFVVGGRDGELVVEPFNALQHGITAWPDGPRKLWRWLQEEGGSGLTGDASRAFSVSRETVGQWAKFLIGRDFIRRIGETKLAGFTITDMGWDYVRSDVTLRQPDVTVTSDLSSDFAPLNRGDLTKGERPDGPPKLVIPEEDTAWQ